MDDAYKGASESWLWFDEDYSGNGSGFATGSGGYDGSGFPNPGLTSGHKDGSGHGEGRASGEGLEIGHGTGVAILCSRSGYGFGNGEGWGMGWDKVTLEQGLYGEDDRE